MKIKFVKDADSNIDVKLIVDEALNDFDYVAMIHQLYQRNHLDDFEFDGEFTQEEKDGILGMATQINNKVDEVLAQVE